MFAFGSLTNAIEREQDSVGRSALQSSFNSVRTDRPAL